MHNIICILFSKHKLHLLIFEYLSVLLEIIPNSGFSGLNTVLYISVGFSASLPVCLFNAEEMKLFSFKQLWLQKSYDNYHSETIITSKDFS